MSVYANKAFTIFPNHQTLKNYHHFMAFISTKTPWKRLFFILLLATLLFVPSFSIKRVDMTTTMSSLQNRKKHDVTGSKDQLGLLLSMKPKGKPVPPSAPSKRHNSVVTSVPPNWIEYYSSFQFFLFITTIWYWIFDD